MQSPRVTVGVILVVANALLALIIAASLRNLSVEDKGASTESSGFAARVEPGATETRMAAVPVQARGANPVSQTGKIEDRAPAAGAYIASEKRASRAKAKRGRILAGLSKNAVSGTLWNHDGSTVRLEATGRGRRLYYVSLAPGAPAKAGDEAFEGVREGPVFSGLAFSFSENCPPDSYPVRGSVSADESVIKMHGKRPRRDAQCSVSGYGDDELTFTLANSATKTAAPTASSMASAEPKAE